MTRRSGQSGYVVKKGRTWHGRYYEDVPGQSERVRKSVPLGLVSELTKSEAKRKLKNWLQEQGINSEETFIQTVKPGKTFAEQAEWWKENKLALNAETSQESRGAYIKNHLLPYFGPMPVCAIGEDQAQEFIRHLSQQGSERSTIESIVSTLKRILGKKVWRDWSLTLPEGSDKEQRFFTPDEMLLIINTAKGTWKPLFALLAETGLRFSEGAGLLVKDLDLAGCKVQVRRSIPKRQEVGPKTSAGVRDIDISPEVARLLTNYLAGRTTGRVFSSKSGRPLTRNNVRHSLHRILAHLEIPKGGLHAFRHGRVSVLQASGVPGDLVREWVGHTSLRTTSRYTHFQNSYRQQIANKVGIFASKPAQMEPKLPSGPKTVTLDPSLPKLGSFQTVVNQGVSW